MGLFDLFCVMFGISVEFDVIMKVDFEDFFGMSMVYFMMEVDFWFDLVDEVVLCFFFVDSIDFVDIVDVVEDIFIVGSEEIGIEFSCYIDGYGYNWVVFVDDDFEDFVMSVYFVVDEFIECGYGLCLFVVLFGFECDGDCVYWIYLFCCGVYYFFVL